MKKGERTDAKVKRDRKRIQDREKEREVKVRDKDCASEEEIEEYLRTHPNFEYPQLVEDKDLYITSLIKKEEYLGWEKRYFRSKFDPELEVDCALPALTTKRKYQHLPEEERKEIDSRISYIQSLKSKNVHLTKRSMRKEGVQLKDLRKDSSLLELKRAEVLEWMGKSFLTPSEVVDKFWELYGVKISYDIAKRFETQHSEKIKELRRNEELNSGLVVIGYKRIRLEKLNYLLKDRLEIYQKTHKVEDSREVRAILEQARKEVEGDKLTLDIQGTIDIEATVRNELQVVMQKTATLTSIILARVANRLNVNPTLLIERLTHSFYSKFNGFRQNTDLGNTEILYPSAVEYDFEEIERVNEGRENQDTVYSLPPVQDPEKISKIGKSLRELLLEKISKVNEIKSNPYEK